MSWKSVLARAESILGSSPAVDLFFLGESASKRLAEQIRELASVTNHKIVSVFYNQLRNNPGSFLNFPAWIGLFSTKCVNQFPQSLLIPMVGQCISMHPNTDLLDQHRKMGETFANINLALTLHRFEKYFFL